MKNLIEKILASWDADIKSLVDIFMRYAAGE